MNTTNVNQSFSDTTNELLKRSLLNSREDQPELLFNTRGKYEE